MKASVTHRIAFACTAVVLFFTAGTALGHMFKGKWAHTTGALVLRYSVSGLLQAHMVTGADSWNATGTAVAFGKVTSQAKIVMLGANLQESWWGLTTYNPCKDTDGCIYSSMYIQINARTLSGQTNLIVNKVCAHELGHALGFTHTSTAATYTSVMKEGALTYSVPQAHEITDIKARYPLN